MIFFVIFIIYRILKYKVEKSHSQQNRASKLVLVLFNVFAVVMATIVFLGSIFTGMNMTYLLFILVYAIVVIDIYKKNKEDKMYRKNSNS